MEHSLNTSKAQEARNKLVVERYFHEVLDQKKFDLMPELLVSGVVLHHPGFDVIGLGVCRTCLPQAGLAPTNS